MHAPRPIVRCAALLVAALACASPPDSEPVSADPDATWERSTAIARRAHRSYRKGDLVVAEANYEKALTAARTFPEGDERLLQTRYSLARLHHKQGRYRLAIRELEALVPEQERRHGASSTPVAATLFTLCHAQVDAGRNTDAQETCRRTLALQEVDPEATLATLGATRLQLAGAERGLRRFDAAETLYLGVLAETSQGRRSSAAAGLAVHAHNGLGLLYTSRRSYREAEPQHLKALSILVKRQARASPDYAIVLRDLGDLYVRTRRYDDARERYDLARERFEKIFGEDHFEVRDTLLRIADLLARTGKPREAGELRYRAEAIPDPRI